MAATVVSTGDGGARVTVDAGNKTLTATTDPVYRYGHLAGPPDATVARLSQEHGVLTVTCAMASISPGQRSRDPTWERVSNLTGFDVTRSFWPI